MIQRNWQNTAETISEQCLLMPVTNGWLARSVITGPDFTCHYQMTCDAGWLFREMLIHTDHDRTLRLRRDAEGTWLEGGGTARPDLAGCVDVDFVLTPFTNTLPIRRLALADNQSATINAAWVDFPSLVVKPDRQIYTRIDALHYRFASPANDFEAEITVDENGLVVDYPKLFRMIGG